MGIFGLATMAGRLLAGYLVAGLKLVWWSRGGSNP
jgi:hypothetical protein